MSTRAVHATLGSKYDTTVLARTHTFKADEPIEAGGTDTAATPTELLMGSLAACTAITVRMYAQRKQWDLGDVRVDVRYSSQPTPHMTKHITVTGTLDDAQRARLAEIAESCPVSKLLRSGVETSSTVG